MSTRLFGTDGMRGVFGQAPMDEQTLRRLGSALGAQLASGPEKTNGSIVLGGDTRFSTPQICRWLAAELKAHGFDSTYLGTMTTPGVVSATRQGGAACGLAVSASHNPAADNGVKLVGGDGFKWTSEAEAALEQRMHGPLELAGGEASLEVERPAVERYLESLTASLESDRLDGLEIAIDAGHGAASPFARQVFEGLGASVTMIGDRPDGQNINLDGGSTQPERLAALVQERGCHLGMAFDGDADRVILVDETGQVRDGDNILYLWASVLEERGELPGSTIVATSMSNLGLEVALGRHNIQLERCDVGDRAVVRTLRQRGYALGGEQSGHIVHLGLATTGDGLLTGLQICRLVQRKEKPLSELLAGFVRFPQVLRSLPVRHKPPLDTLPKVQETARSIEKTLGSEGRLVLRYSGTEALVRTMIEGPDLTQIEDLADQLESVLSAELS